MTDHDRRQLESMLEHITAYEKNEIAMFDLIANIEIMSDFLQDIPEVWLDRLKEEWAILEVVHAVALYREQPIQGEERVSVDSAVRNMKDMIVKLLAE